jgi:acetoin utilization protein AcuB
MTEVRALMSGNVATVPTTATCHRAVELMHQRRIRHVPVVEGDGTLCGIVTDRDLRHHLFEPRVWKEIGTTPVESLLDAATVKEVMSVPVVTVAPGEPVEAAAALMRGHRVGSLPVVERGRVVGIVTETDLLRHIVGEDAASREVQEIVISFP